MLNTRRTELARVTNGRVGPYLVDTFSTVQNCLLVVSSPRRRKREKGGSVASSVSNKVDLDLAQLLLLPLSSKYRRYICMYIYVYTYSSLPILYFIYGRERERENTRDAIYLPVPWRGNVKPIISRTCLRSTRFKIRTVVFFYIPLMGICEREKFTIPFVSRVYTRKQHSLARL